MCSWEYGIKTDLTYQFIRVWTGFMWLRTETSDIVL